MRCNIFLLYFKVTVCKPLRAITIEMSVYQSTRVQCFKAVAKKGRWSGHTLLFDTTVSIILRL